MVLYLTEDILNESVSGNEVSHALSSRKAVLINYADEHASHTGKRYIEPYVYGLTKAGNQALRAYQYWGDTKTGTPAWKLFRLDRIESWEETDNIFDIEPQARGWAAEAFNKGGDTSLIQVYQIVNLEDNPLTDYEKLKARRMAAQQSRNININNVDLRPIQKQETKSELQPQDKVQSGPVNAEQPQAKTERPEVSTITKTTSEPLNSQGKETEEQPIKPEPKKEGPIVGNVSNPEEHSSNELMSNDEFKKMLQRNLEITAQEKQRRNKTMNGLNNQ